MKTRVIVEDVSGTLNRRYFAEIEDGDEIRVRREGRSVELAAAAAVDALRYKADDAERKLVETGTLPMKKKDD